MRAWLLACLLCAAPCERTHYGLDVPTEPVLSPGDLVRVEGLSSAAGQKLNGQQGRLVEWVEHRGRFHVQLRSGIKSLKPMNLKPKVLLQRDVLAHQLLNMARNDSCANVPASVLASRVANVMWFLGLERTGDCTEMTCSYFEGITWTQDCQVLGISLPGEESISGNFSSVDLQNGGTEVLKPLQQMNLAGTGLKGDLHVLEALPQLKALNLSNNHGMAGNLEVFQFTPLLEELDLAFTAVKGDVRVFETTVSLRSLRLTRSFAFGKIEFLEKLLHLERLDLSWSAVKGMLEFGLPRLTDLDLSGTQIRGDLGLVLRKMRNVGAPMKRLNISWTEMWGHTMSLARSCPMEQLAVAHTGIYMRLRHFWNCTSLRTLDLANSRVRGDVSGFRNIPQVEELDLSSSKISGSCEAFGYLPKLRRLVLQNTEVDGDVSVFSWTLNLVHLDLHDTRVNGRLKARLPLKDADFHMPGLEAMDFTNTEVNGDLSTFPSAPKLRRLALNSSYVGGDLKVLGSKVKALQILEVARTKVNGDISALKSLPDLVAVDVTSTRVRGDIGALSWKLHKAIFSWSNVSGDIQVFRNFKDLKSVSLDHTRVYGDIQAFRLLDVQSELNLAGTEVHGNIEDFAETFENLGKLDLSSTNVTGDINVISSTMAVGRLREFVMDDTKVFGDIKVFKPLWRLERILLSRTGVWGDIDTFASDSTGTAKFSNVQELSLSFTKVHGSIDYLSTAQKLIKLDLASTKVGGELRHLMACPKLQFVDLSNTSINGSFKFIITSWADLRLEHLEILKLANTQMTLEEHLVQTNWVSVLTARKDFTLEGVFPVLHTLDLSGSPLNGNLSTLLMLVGLSRHLHTLEAGGCQLFGNFPDLEEWKSPLWDSLGKVVLQNNNITWVDAIPPNLIVLDLSRNPQVGFTREVMKQAIEQGVYVDLQNSSLLDETPARMLMESQDLRMSSYIDMSKPKMGYECHQVLNEKLRVSPDLFLPEVLCQCLPGWEGIGTTCVKCPEDFFNSESNGTCQKCPKDSKSPRASTSPDACSCPSGQEIFSRNDTLQCGCRHSFAFQFSGDCVECEELKLQCPAPGMKTWEAEPKAGYVRMEENSSKVYLCLSAARCSRPNCSQGFAGPLCVDCASGYRSVRGSCEACSKEPPSLVFYLTSALVLLVVALALVGVGVYMYRSASPTPMTGKWKVLQELAKAQAPVLLQLCQLWAALAVLSFVGKRSEELVHVHGKDHEEDGGSSWISTFWELPYVQTLQLSLNAFKDSVALQCSLDGTSVRFLGALAAPLLPLAILAACGILELPYPTKGINAALKVLTLLFIGGASSCANLLTCQYVDGDDEPLGQHAFRLHMPQLQCTDDSWPAFWVDLVAYTASFVYGVFIPLLLLHLFSRQHLLMRTCRSVAAVTQVDADGQLRVFLQSLTADGKLLFKESSQLTGRLVAASAARIAVSQQGHLVKLRMENEVMCLEDLGQTSARGSFDDSLDENVASWIASEEEMKSGSAVRCRTISEMLMERCTLEEAQNSERTLTGAKEIFYKYSSCRHVWMEVFLKLVSVALVSSDGMGDFGFQLSVAICLVTSCTIALARPYAQPQVNTLHSSCFACLALASVGFYHHFPWLSRGGLLLPFLLASVQLLRPDSAEALSVRLFDELSQKRELRDGKEVSLDAGLWHFG